MKNKVKLLNILVMIGAMIILVACTNEQDSDVLPYVPKLPEYSESPDIKLNLEVTQIESGSALLKTEDKSDAAYYVFEVSAFEKFPDLYTQKLTSLTSEYRLFFDDNSKLYVRAYAVTHSGYAYKNSDTKVILSKYASHVVLDNFSDTDIEDWDVKGARIQSDFHSLIVNPTEINTPVKISKTYLVDFDLAEIFEIKLATKNIDSQIKITLDIGDNSYEVVSHMATITKGYIRFNLETLHLEGNHPVKVTIISEGQNRGFQVDYIRFIYEREHQTTFPFITNNLDSNYNQIEVKNYSLNIKNDPEPTVSRDPNVEVNFNPSELPFLEISLTDYRPSDTLSLVIRNGLQEEVYSMQEAFIQNHQGAFSINLTAYDITEEDVYTITYILSHERVQVQSMQLVGASDVTVDVTKANNWVDGFGARMTDDNKIVLKPTIYAYGDIRKTLTVDLGATPIIFFDVEAVSGQWAVKVIPEGAVSDMYVAPDNSNTGISSFNIANILGAHEVTTFTLELFIIGSGPNDLNAFVQMNPIKFGNALSIVSEIPEGVESTVSYHVEGLNIDDVGYVYIDIELLTPKASWRLYLVDSESNRRFEMKTSLERKYTQRYSRTKSGKYIYDIKEITGLSGVRNFEVVIILYGNHSEANVHNIVFTHNNNIPTASHSGY